MAQKPRTPPRFADSNPPSLVWVWRWPLRSGRALPWTTRHTGDRAGTPGSCRPEGGSVTMAPATHISTLQLVK